MYPGSYPYTIEIYQAPEKYEYDPVLLLFTSNCDNQPGDSIWLTTSWVRVF
jgi:hypothetical protein